MQGYDRYLDEPEQAHEPLYCPCGNPLDNDAIQMGYETCERCRAENQSCSRCGESLTVEDYRRGDSLCKDCYTKLACLDCGEPVFEGDLRRGDGLCGVCRERKERAREASA